MSSCGQSRFLSIRSDTRLTIVGEGSEETGLRKLIGELGIAANVRFANEVDDETLAELYHDSTVVVPSRSEVFGVVILEAFAANRPVVATATFRQCRLSPIGFRDALCQLEMPKELQMR